MDYYVYEGDHGSGAAAASVGPVIVERDYGGDYGGDD